MIRKPNNPRAFAETISLDAWRAKFDSEKGDADLHVDVSFHKGRVGGPGIPVRFRLSLRRAEVHVRLDQAGILRIPPSSVRRAPLPSAEISRESELHQDFGVGAGIFASGDGVAGKITANAASSVQSTEVFKETTVAASMKVSHKKTEEGYAFALEPIGGRRILIGQPWHASETLLSVRDTKHLRQRGEPPEPIIEIQCRREDLSIEDVQFANEKKYNWRNLTRNKQIAVEQYLKEELGRAGFFCGDVSDPFSCFVLSDAIPMVDE